MKKATFTILKCFMAVLLVGQFKTNAQTYNLVWSDEFNGSISNSWRHETGGGGWGNNELEYYQPNNATVSSTELIITAKKENVGGMPYTSSRMVTLGSANPKTFTFGRFVARMRLPMVQGLWPAFWMLGSNIGSVGWPACGEIDIMEHVNLDANVLGTVHWDAGGHAQYGQSYSTTPGNYHEYSVDWSSTYINWAVDGVQYNSFNITNGTGNTEEFQRPFYILLNLAVGGNLPGSTINDSQLPATMAVDYVRVYQAGSSFTQKIEAENYISMSGIQTESCTEGGLDVGWIDAGDWMAYNVNIPTAGTYKVSYRVASIYSGKTLRLEKDNGATQLGSVTIPNTGNWQGWTTVAHNVTLPAGAYTVGIASSTGGFNLNWFEITNSSLARLGEPEVTQAEDTQPSFYPNPVKDKLNYQLPAGVLQHKVSITDFNGRTVMMQNFGNVGSNNSIDLSKLKKGLYIIRISDRGFIKTIRLEKD